MAPLDFNEAEPQRSFDLIPDGTVASVRMHVRPGDAGEGGWLKRSKKGDSEALDCEFVVLDGAFTGRKFWSLLTATGTTDGHAQAADITNRRLRAALESARGIKPEDESDAARIARQVNSYGDLDGLCSIARIGVEPPQGAYKAKNTLDRVITPDETLWHPVTQQPAHPKPAASQPAPQSSRVKIERPQWGRH